MTGAAERALAALNVRPNEARTAGLLVLNSFLNGLARVVILAAGGAIFLDSQPLESIPYVYIALGVAGGAIGLLIARAEAALPYARFLTGLLAFTGIVTGLLWVALALFDAGWAPFVVALWSNLSELLITLVIGAVAGRALDLRQSKRINAVVGSGETIAEIGGGLALPVMVALVGARGLLVVVVASLAAGLVVSRYVLTTRHPKESDEAAPETREAGGATAIGGLLALLRNNYLRLVLLIGGLDTLYFFSVEAGFWVETKAHFGDEDEIASFFGLAFGGIAVVTLLTRALVASRLLRRWGLVAGLVAGPVLWLPMVLGVVALGQVSPGAAAIFWLFVAARLSYDVTYSALYQPAYEVLFEGLPPGERLRAFSAVETFAKPILTGLAGVFLLALMAVAPLGAFSVACASMVMLVVWIAASLAVRRGYVEALRQTLGKRLIGGTSLTLGDATSLGVLENGLASGHPGAVLFALGRLEQVGHWDVTPWLGRLLAHPAEDVRAEALRRVERLRLAALRPTVAALAQDDPAPGVRAAAVRALAAAGGEDEVEAVAAYVPHADRAVRRGALVGLVLHGGFAGFVAAGEALLRLRGSAEPGDRALVADALGEVGARPIFRPLEPLLSDADPAVRRAALKAAGRIGNPALWPVAVRALDDAETGAAAGDALVAGGASTLPALTAAFDAADADRDRRRRIIAVVARIGDEAATAALAERLEYPDVPIRHQLLRALTARSFRAEGATRDAAWRLIAAELDAAAWTLASIADLEHSPAAWLLRETLGVELARIRERTLWLLTFVDPRDPVLDAVRNLASDSAEQRDYATEVLDNVIASELKGAILALVEPDEPRAQLARFGPMFAQPHLDPDARLGEVVGRPAAWLSPWARACAVAAGGQLGVTAWRAGLTDALSSPDAVVRETAAWTLAWVGMDDAATEAVKALERDPAPNVAAMARYVLAPT